MSEYVVSLRGSPTRRSAGGIFSYILVMFMLSVKWSICLFSFGLENLPIAESGTLKCPSVRALFCDFTFRTVGFRKAGYHVFKA